jgi:hypothetical protein
LKLSTSIKQKAESKFSTGQKTAQVRIYKDETIALKNEFKWLKNEPPSAKGLSLQPLKVDDVKSVSERIRCHYFLCHFIVTNSLLLGADLGNLRRAEAPGSVYHLR